MNSQSSHVRCAFWQCAHALLAFFFLGPLVGLLNFLVYASRSCCALERAQTAPQSLPACALVQVFSWKIGAFVLTSILDHSSFQPSCDDTQWRGGRRQQGGEGLRVQGKMANRNNYKHCGTLSPTQERPPTPRLPQFISGARLI